MMENQLLWRCVRKTLSPTDQDTIVEIFKQGDLDWNSLYDVALEQQAASILMTNLTKVRDRGLVLPQELINRHKSTFAFQLVYRNKLAKDLERILEYFGQKAVNVLLAKGMALSLTVHKHSAQYVPGDIDMMLSNRRADISDEEDQADIHFFQSLNYYPEWERFEHHDLSINGLLPIDFRSVWQHATAIEIGSKKLKAYVLCPEDMLLFTCINACRKRYFRLKSVFDMAEIIRFYPNLNWHKLVQDAKNYHCQSIVYTALWVTQLTVGCSVPEGVLPALHVHPIKAWAIRKLINFFIARVPLSELSSSQELEWSKVNPALLLVAITYSWPQTWQRVEYVWEMLKRKPLTGNQVTP